MLLSFYICFLRAPSLTLAKLPALFAMTYDTKNENKPFSFCTKREKSQHLSNSPALPRILETWGFLGNIFQFRKKAATFVAEEKL